ncbi:hypothetical protein Bca52824_064708 [Brassica carinata]|uniref:TFIIS N-terminal domain-containing protein n=1 Tax=Brassica carinata TaxID=52824 RepID=A0A8X7QLT9_BRACI|nr:hypothetical protein Bca52824_064708 [Brassica carinata]
MGFEDDPYRDVDGEPLVDLDDDFGDDREPLENFEDNLADDMGDWDDDGSQTPLYDNDKVKPRKRLVKKASSDRQRIDVPELIDEDVEDAVFDEYMEGRGGGGGGSEYDDKVGRKRKKEKERSSSGGGKEKRYKLPSRGERKSEEIDEMWKSIADNPENDEEGVRTMDDDNFIDDTGVDPSERYGGDGGDRSPTHYPQAEEDEDDDEVNNLFKMGKKKKKAERNPAEIALLVENVMAELEVTAEEDAELNRQGKPAINKLKKLSFLPMFLESKKQLQTEFLDHGVLTLLKNWLEPLPDGSLPNINIRAAILRVLTDFPIDLEQYDRREQLKKSGLGKVIMFLSKSDEETTSNRRLAKDLVDKWSRPIFNKSTRFEDMRNLDEDRAPYRRPPVKKPVNKASTMESRDGDFDLDIRQRKSGLTSGQSSRGDSSRNMTMRPEATPMDFLIRPQSKIDPDEVRARAKQVSQDQRRVKMNKKLQQLKGPKKKRLQATTVSVEGRGMTKYL